MRNQFFAAVTTKNRRCRFVFATQTLIAALIMLHSTPAAAADPIDVLVVVGADGTTEFGSEFEKWASVWKTTCDQAQLNLQSIGPTDGNTPDRQQLELQLKEIATTPSSKPLWLILIGHGTWDGKTANFNLVGPDISANELGDWLSPVERPLVVVNCTSSSGPFINRLSAPQRVIITATKSGSEQNYARFGEYFAKAFESTDADLDHDDSISLREAFLNAADNVDRFYRQQNRLSTEHALLDDNGDRKGSSPELIQGTAKAKGDAEIDGTLAGRISIATSTDAPRFTPEQIQRRDALEAQLTELQNKFDDDDREALRRHALPVLFELARLYAESDSRKNGQ